MGFGVQRNPFLSPLHPSLTTSSLRFRMKSSAAFALVFALSVQGVVGQLALFSGLAGGRYMGSAVDNIEVHPLEDDKEYSKRLGNILDFNQITPVCTSLLPLQWT